MSSPQYLVSCNTARGEVVGSSRTDSTHGSDALHPPLNVAARDGCFGWHSRQAVNTVNVSGQISKCCPAPGLQTVGYALLIVCSSSRPEANGSCLCMHKACASCNHHTSRVANLVTAPWGPQMPQWLQQRAAQQSRGSRQCPAASPSAASSRAHTQPSSATIIS